MAHLTPGAISIVLASFNRISWRHSDTFSDIPWVGSLQMFLLFFIGTFSGRAMNAGYFKLTFVLGAFVESSISMASLCTEYWQLHLAQGFE